MAVWDVVKWVRKVGVTGAFTGDISAYYENYNVSMIVLTRTAGTPSTIKIGFTPGGDEVCFETDISHLALQGPICLSLDQSPATGNNTLYFNIASGTFTVDVLMIQRIGA